MKYFNSILRLILLIASFICFFGAVIAYNEHPQDAAYLMGCAIFARLVWMEKDDEKDNNLQS